MISTACAPVFEAYPSQNEDIIHFVDITKAEGAKRGIIFNTDDVGMEFSLLMPYNTLGYCRKMEIQYLTEIRTYKKIILNTIQWVTMSVASKEQLVSHELGHCVLGREHVDGYIDVELNNKKTMIPESLMSTYSFSDHYFKNFREYYYDELFQIKD
jgi:hypothetical protein